MASSEVIPRQLCDVGILALILFAAEAFSQEMAIPYDVIAGTKENTPVKIFTTTELNKYDGSDPATPIYIGVKGVIVDVSSSKRLYGKHSAYNALVGRDSTCAVAKMSLDEEDLKKGHDISGLDETYLQDLETTFKHIYLAKYPIVGYMDYLLTVADFKEQMKQRDGL